jgi:hypothetical protein
MTTISDKYPNLPIEAIDEYKRLAKEQGKTLDLILQEKYESIQYQIFVPMKKGAQAYVDLLNVMPAGLSYDQAKNTLKDLRLAARDVFNVVQGALQKLLIFPQDVRDLSHRHPKDVDLLWNNLAQFAARFCVAPPPVEGQRGNDLHVQNLTTLYFLAKDFVEAIDATPVERYYRLTGSEKAL